MKPLSPGILRLKWALVTLFFWHTATAQSSVSGYVFEVSSGKPLADVEIVVHDGLQSRSTFSSHFGRYSVDSLSTNPLTLVGILRTKVNGEWTRFMLRSSDLLPVPQGVEIHFGFSVEQLEAMVYSSVFESKGNAVNSPAMDSRTDSLFRPSTIQDTEGTDLLVGVTWIPETVHDGKRP